MRRYETASVRYQTSLAAPNVGKAIIISVGLTLVMFITGQGMVAGPLTIGTFVMTNTYLMQLYQL